MEDKYTDDHEVKTEERQMRVEDHVLTDKKVTTFIEGHYSGRFSDSKTIVEHTQIIENTLGKRSVKVTEHFINGYITGKRTVETEMTEEEMEQFENDWDKFSNMLFLKTHPNLTHISQVDFSKEI